MMLVVPMQEHHVRAINPQEAQSGQSVEERVRDAMLMAKTGSAWAVVGEEGVMCIAGVQGQWQGRGVAWCLLDKRAAKRMLAMTRTVLRYLDGLNYARLEMYVDAGFHEGCRWATMLGFKNETPNAMPNFLPNGNAAYMYGRIR